MDVWCNGQNIETAVSKATKLLDVLDVKSVRNLCIFNHKYNHGRNRAKCTFAPAGGVCGGWHRNPFHTGRPQLLREGCEQWEETRWDHSHADRGRCRDSRMCRVALRGSAVA